MTKPEMLDRIKVLFLALHPGSRFHRGTDVYRQLAAMSDERLAERLAVFESRMAEKNAQAAACRAKQAAEPVVVPRREAPWLTTNVGTGGGSRVVRKSDGMS